MDIFIIFIAPILCYLLIPLIVFPENTKIKLTALAAQAAIFVAQIITIIVRFS